MWTVLAWISAAAISLASLKYLTIPYLWIFLAGAAALFVTAATDKHRRAWWFNVACLCVGLAFFEYYLWTSSHRAFMARRVVGGTYAEHLTPHEQLGWALEPASRMTQKLSFEGELIYDATYTIGPDGLRISSPPTADHERFAGCALFFGDSFTFGQGLADDEALPFRVHERSEQRYRTYNFGRNGYGAHQMLSALQHGLVQEAVQCDPEQVTHVFYQAITDHPARSAGRAWWEYRGPKYVLNENGSVILSGSFEENDDYYEERSLIELVGAQIFKSMIYRRVSESIYVRQYGDDVLDLYLGIVDEARKEVLADYPNASFHVLLWDEANADNQAMEQGLRERGITVHLMSDILPDYRPDALNEQYRLHARDPHPNALAVDLIAEYIVREILGEPRISSRFAPAIPSSFLSDFLTHPAG